MPKHTYKIRLYATQGSICSLSSEEPQTYTNKREALKALHFVARRERKATDSWVVTIKRLNIELEDETGETVYIETAFER